MRKLIILGICLIGIAAVVNQPAANEEITNLMLIPEGFGGYDALEEMIETAEAHDGLLHVKRSDGVFSPFGPSDYVEVVEFYWKSMDGMIDWSKKMQEQIPDERRATMEGLEVLFYQYKDE